MNDQAFVIIHIGGPAYDPEFVHEIETGFLVCQVKGQYGPRDTIKLTLA